MRTALRSKAKTPRTQVATEKSYPAPVGGWNARDALATMPLTDAVTLDNMFPKASFVELRGGTSQYTNNAVVTIITEAGLNLVTEDNDTLVTEDPVSLISGNIKTLAVYNSVSGSRKMFGMTNTGVFDVTNGGAVAAAVIARTDGKHQYVQFGDGTNEWLVACNGVDNPLYYDGTTWTAATAVSSPGLIGVTPSNLIAPINHKGRLYFIEKATLSLWYLSAGLAGGTLTKFDISGDAPHGGFIMAGMSWTRDSGAGQDDVLVLVTSEGDALVYQGNNPSSAANWSKIGSFFIGKPIGRRCLEKMGGEIVVLTENGAFAISNALLTAEVNAMLAMSDKIVRAFTESARIYGGVFGWESIVFPAHQALIVNVPNVEDGIHYQYVMNTQTKAWCRFTGWNAETFAVFGTDLYFAHGTIVYKAWTGNSDGTSNIEWLGKQAFSQFGHTGMNKPEMFRPILQTNGSVRYDSAIDIDFDDSRVNGSTVAATTTLLPVWGQITWGNFTWGGGQTTLKPWGSAAAHPGYWLSGKIKGATSNSAVKWMASDLVFQSGGVL